MKRRTKRDESRIAAANRLAFVCEWLLDVVDGRKAPYPKRSLPLFSLREVVAAYRKGGAP